MVPNSVSYTNLVVLANATELATELALDVIKNSTVLERSSGSTNPKREELQNAFVAKLGSTLINQ